MSYRPITDVWILARPKVKYHGAYPAGFLSRARALMGVRPHDPILHVCAGKIREYPGPHAGIYYKGLGPNDKTLDLDATLTPDFVRDAREPLPLQSDGREWEGVLIDRPYDDENAQQYRVGAEALPELNPLLKNALSVVPVGHRVGVLDFTWPHPGQKGHEVAVVAVGCGRNQQARWFTVFERLS